MKKRMNYLLALSMLAVSLCACGKDEEKLNMDSNVAEVVEMEGTTEIVEKVQEDEFVVETKEEQAAEASIEEEQPKEKTEEEVYQEYYNNLMSDNSGLEVAQKLGKVCEKYGAGEYLLRTYSYYEDCGAGSVEANLRTDNCDYVMFEDGTALVERVKDVSVLEPEIEHEGRTYQIKYLGGVHQEADVVEIPSFIEIIRQKGLCGCKAREIIIPDSVKHISGNSTFFGCTNLEKVTFPKEFTTTDVWCDTFKNCENLKEITIPDEVTILSNTFENCYGLESVTMSENVSALCGTFVNCTSLKEIELPDTIKYMEETFMGSGIENVELPRYIMYLGWRVFENTPFGQNGITEMVLPKTLIAMDINFYKGTNVTEIIVPEHVVGLYRTTVSECPLLEKIVIPDTTEMPYGVRLMNTPKVQTIVYPDSIMAEQIEKYDFTDAKLDGILTLYMPEGVIGGLDKLGDNIMVMPKDGSQ